MDLDFLAELQSRFGAAGDTAQAYILAHEIGHHVQHLLGISEEVQAVGSNEASIALELQADCFAGVWLSTLRTGSSAAVLEANDLQEALNAAAAVGDDAIQSQTTGRVNPESWTHGSSEDRYRWLNEGFTTGSPGSCDTFAQIGG
jgi:predicted metalloprotease